MAADGGCGEDVASWVGDVLASCEEVTALVCELEQLMEGHNGGESPEGDADLHGTLEANLKEVLHTCVAWSAWYHQHVSQLLAATRVNAPQLLPVAACLLSDPRVTSSEHVAAKRARKSHRLLARRRGNARRGKHVPNNCATKRKGPLHPPPSLDPAQGSRPPNGLEAPSQSHTCTRGVVGTPNILPHSFS